MCPGQVINCLLVGNSSTGSGGAIRCDNGYKTTLVRNCTVVNYYLPDKEMAVLVQVGVHYDSDLKKVEQVTIDVARQVMKEVPGEIQPSNL